MAARSRHRIYLVPGFFGFANLGEIRYFGHVRRALEAILRDGGVAGSVHVVRTHPTASLRTRARRLESSIARTSRGADRVHVIGHSSGGLDARLLLAPRVDLGGRSVEAVVRRVRSVVTIATPHHGTAIASFFAGGLGGRLLRVLSIMTILALRQGRAPLRALLALGGAVAAVDRRVGVGTRLLDQLFGQLLADFSPDRRRAIERFFRDVQDDQSLLRQLTPEAMDVFAATVPNRPGVRYGSVVTRARRPGVGSTIAAGVDPAAHATHALFAAFGRLARIERSRPTPGLGAAQRRALERGFGRLPTRADTDGIVPSLSQVHGTVVATAAGDHLDVLGHFDDPDHAPPHHDWLASGTGFDRQNFDRVWHAVARFVLRAA